MAMASVDHPDISHTSHSEELPLHDLSGDCQAGTKSTLPATERRPQPFLDDDACFSSQPQTSLGFSITSDGLEPGPVFNYARAWIHTNGAEHIAEAFVTFTVRQKSSNPAILVEAGTKVQIDGTRTSEGPPRECRSISPQIRRTARLLDPRPCFCKFGPQLYYCRLRGHVLTVGQHRCSHCHCIQIGLQLLTQFHQCRNSTVP